MATAATASPAKKVHRLVCLTASVCTNYEQDNEFSNDLTPCAQQFISSRPLNPRRLFSSNNTNFKVVPGDAKGCTHQEPKNKQIMEVGRVRCVVVAVAEHDRAELGSVVPSYTFHAETVQTCFLAMSKLSQGDHIWGHNRTNCTHKQITCPSTSGRLVQLLILTNSHLQVIPSITIYI